MRSSPERQSRTRGGGPDLTVPQCQSTPYPKDPGAEQCRSSSGDGRSQCLIDIGDSFERSPSRCGGRPRVSTGRGRASITRGHRGGWRYGAHGQSCGLPLRYPAAAPAELYLLEVGDRRAGN